MKNPPREQDRVRDLIEHFDQYGDVMFRQQRAIYKQIGQHCRSANILEFGCGVGVGSAILYDEMDTYEDRHVTATDISLRNIEFARCLYPWISFTVWDLMNLWTGKKFKEVVAIECIEHAADPLIAICTVVDATLPGGTAWISTPNGRGKESPPTNPYHVAELTPVEVVQTILTAAPSAKVLVRHWETFKQIHEWNTDVDPLVYEVRL